MTTLAAPDLEALERDVLRALGSGESGGLCVLGWGEVSMVVGWPPGEPRWACKRVVLRDRTAYGGYRDVFERYLLALRARGVDVVESTLQPVARSRAVVAYCVQPLLPRESLVPAVLRDEEPDADHPALAGVLRHVAEVVDPTVGLDGQLANWAWPDGRLRFFDVTTPFLRDAAGADQLDVGMYAAMAPWVLRPAARRMILPGILGRYHDARLVALDLAVNLLRLRLDRWLPAALAAVERELGFIITAEEVRADYRSEARTWTALLWLRRADRAWQTRVRHRPYPFLLPVGTGW